MYKNREKEEEGGGIDSAYGVGVGAEGGIVTVVIAIVYITIGSIPTVSIANHCHSNCSHSNRGHGNYSSIYIAIVTVAITTVAIANVNLTTVTIANVIKSFKVLLTRVMIDSRYMADCYRPVAVGGWGGVLVIFSLPRGCYYLF